MIKKNILIVVSLLLLIPSVFSTYGCEQNITPSQKWIVGNGEVVDMDFYDGKMYASTFLISGSSSYNSVVISIVDILKVMADPTDSSAYRYLRESDLGIDADCSAYGKCVGHLTYDPEDNRIFFNFCSDVEEGLLIYDLDTNSVTYKNTSISCWVINCASELAYSTKHDVLAFAEGCNGLHLYFPNNNTFIKIQSFYAVSYPPSVQANVQWCGDYLIFHGADGYHKQSTWVYHYPSGHLFLSSLQSYDPYAWVDCSEEKVYQIAVDDFFYPVDFSTESVGSPVFSDTLVNIGQKSSRTYSENDRILINPFGNSFEVKDRDSNETILYCGNASKWSGGNLPIREIFVYDDYDLIIGAFNTAGIFIWGTGEVEPEGFYCGSIGICFDNILCFLESLLQSTISFILCVQPMFILVFIVAIAGVLLLAMKNVFR